MFKFTFQCSIFVKFLQPPPPEAQRDSSNFSNCVARVKWVGSGGVGGVARLATVI